MKLITQNLTQSKQRILKPDRFKVIQRRKLSKEIQKVIKYEKLRTSIKDLF